MIYLVTSRESEYDWEDLANDDIVQGNFDEFVNWTIRQKLINLDTETTMVKSGPNQHEERQLLVMQFGSIDRSVQWIIDMVNLHSRWITVIERILQDPHIQFIIHYATFDYVVIKAQLGIEIAEIHDTCLMSKILNPGLDTIDGYHSLAGCLKRFFDLDISKEAQKSFTGAVITKEQLIYCAIDVVMLYDLFLKLKELLESWNLWYVYNEVERKVLKVYGDMELTPMRFDKAHWGPISQDFIKERASLEADLNAEVLKDAALVAHLKNSKQIIKDYLIQPMDELKINWASVTHKNLVLKKLVPSLPEEVRTKPELKAWFKSVSDTLTPEEISTINLYLARSYDALTALILKLDKQWLKDNGLFIDENTILINWGSNVHKLFIFQFYYPKLDDTNAKSLARITKNPLITIYKQFAAVNKNVTTYGEEFVVKYVDRRSMIAPSGVNQILATGRISFGVLLQLPKSQKFRNAFLPPEKDWAFVDSDFSSAEIAIMAWASKEYNFINAIKSGKDLHMMTSSMIYSSDWVEIAEPGCTHIINGAKCSCKEHNKRRQFAKTIVFGLLYGLGVSGLADRLDITRQESQALMDKFFAAFPSIKGYLDGVRSFGISNLYIRSLPPTNRIRFYAHPQDEQERASIGRESQNFAIQETNASILKVALIKLSTIIKDKKYPVRLHLPIHDEILSSCPKAFADTWKPIQEKAMCEAADMFLEPGLLGVETNVTDKWTK